MQCCVDENHSGQVTALQVARAVSLKLMERIELKFCTEVHMGPRSGHDDSRQMLVGQSGVTMATVITILFNRGNGVNATPKNWEPPKKTNFPSSIVHEILRYKSCRKN